MADSGMMDQVEQLKVRSQSLVNAVYDSACCSVGKTNISRFERWGCTLGGSALLLLGLRRGKTSGVLMSLVGSGLIYRGMTGHCYCYDALGIDTSESGDATTIPAQQGVKVEQSITIRRAPKDLFTFWREVENLPRVMRHLESVEAVDNVRSRWVARSTAGVPVEWEAEIFNEREPELIAWRSLPGSQLDTAGSVHFRYLGDEFGTELTVSLKYNPPAGKIGASIASLLGAGFEQRISDDLESFKQLMEGAPAASGDQRT